MLSKQEFINRCDQEICTMSNVAGTSYDKCADSMYGVYCDYQIDENETNEIIDKLSNTPLENLVSVNELGKVLEKLMKQR